MLEQFRNIINNVMVRNDTSYKINTFDSFDSNFFELVNNKNINKVYILDIEIKDKSGIDVARKIRKNDLESIIIFVSKYDLKNYVVSQELLCLVYVNKYDDLTNKLASAIKTSLRKINKKQILNYTFKGIQYHILLDSILYIMKEKNSKNSLIYTSNNIFKINMNINEILNLLNVNFKLYYRSYIINNERVVSFDKKSKTITFDDKSILRI